MGEVPVNVGVVGLGKLGLPFALTFARAGADVLVWDEADDVRRAVENRHAHIDEPHVQKMLESYTLKILEPREMMKSADVIFIIVPTPSLANGSFDHSHVLAAIEALGEGNAVIAVVSTLSPGTLTHVLVPLVRKRGLALVYTPTLIALGTVVHDLTNPDVLIIGHDGSGFAASHALVALRVIARNAPAKVTDYESAAIAKLASNVFVTMKIGFINSVAQLCDLHNANVDDVTFMLGHNKRIGPKSLTAGAGFGGPCFPRDAAAFAVAGGELGDAVLELNESHLTYVVNRIVALLRDVRDPFECNTYVSVRDSTFTVLGRAYKEGAAYRIESFGDRIADALTKLGMLDVRVETADVVVIAQPLKARDLSDLVKPGAIIYDLWRRHGYLAALPNVTYVRLGRPT